MARRVFVAAALILAVSVAAGCSSSKGSTPGTSEPGNQTRTTTVSAERLGLIGAAHVVRARALLRDERTNCGGTDRVEARGVALARRCTVALLGLAAEARSFARALVFLRAPDDLEPLVANTIDAARPVVDLVHSYPVAVCLPTPVSTAGPRATRCARAGSDIAIVIHEFEQSLASWRAVKQ